MTGLEQTQAASSAWVTPTFVCLYKDLDAWWNSVPKRRKQKLDAEIRRQRKFAADWLVRHELFLPREDAGRDSTNIQPYKYFYKHDTRDLEMDDQDGAGFAARYYAEVPVEHRDAGTLCDLASARFYAERTSTLDSVENASANAMFVAGVSSGPLASSWSKVERALLLSRHATGKRYQTRTEREEPTKYTYVEKTLMRFDPTLGEFRPVLYQEIADGALDSLRHRQAHKSRPIKTKWTTAEYCPAAALRITHPRGGAREWSGDTSDRDYQAWLESGDYASLLAFQKSLPTSYPRSL